MRDDAHQMVLPTAEAGGDHVRHRERRVGAAQVVEGRLLQLEGLRKLVPSGYVALNRVRAMEREVADLDGKEGTLRSDGARLTEAIGEARLEILGIDRRMMEEVSTELRDVQVGRHRRQRELLRRHRTALVLVDLNYMPHPADLAQRFDLFTTDFTYARLIGDRKAIDALGKPIDLEVDGGVNVETAKRCIKAGADVLVAGTAVFTGGPERYAANIEALRS